MNGPAKPRSRRWLVLGLFSLLVLSVAAFVLRDDILGTALDPKVPFQTYRPGPPANYGRLDGWALYPVLRGPSDPPVDVFFIHPTTYDGGGHWVAPIPHPRTDPILFQVMLPNYAGPFAKVGRIYAPRYRHASLFTLIRAHRDDAREAREFAYADVRDAFRRYLARDNGGRPFIIVGVEQGGSIGARLLRDEVAADPAVRARLVAAYLIETVVPADEFGPDATVPGCVRQDQAGCALAWISVVGLDPERSAQLLGDALVWRRQRLIRLDPSRAPLCVNPILGREGAEMAPARLALGAANATGLEWGARPAFLVRQISAHCEDGILRVSTPRSSTLRRSGGWADRLRVPGYNLFYADLEADAQRRVATFLARPSPLPTETPRASRTTAPAPSGPVPVAR